MNTQIQKESLVCAIKDCFSCRDIVDFLNEIIDNELEKDFCEIDCALIDECTKAIESLQSLESENTPLSEKNIIRFCKRKNARLSASRAVAVASILLIIAGVTTFSVSPAFAENTKEFFNEIILLIEKGQENEEHIEKLSSIYVTLPSDSDLSVKSPDDINFDDITVTAVFNDNTEKVIENEKCRINKTVKAQDGKNYVFVTVSYGDCSCVVVYNLEVK